MSIKLEGLQRAVPLQDGLRTVLRGPRNTGGLYGQATVADWRVLGLRMADIAVSRFDGATGYSPWGEVLTTLLLAARR
jgi:hypothetical protein